MNGWRGVQVTLWGRCFLKGGGYGKWHEVMEVNMIDLGDETPMMLEMKTWCGRRLKIDETAEGYPETGDRCQNCLGKLTKLMRPEPEPPNTDHLAPGYHGSKEWFERVFGNPPGFGIQGGEV